MTEHNTLERLQALIAEEHRALLAGDLHALGDILEEKETLAAELEDLSPATEDVSAVKVALRRNQELFDEALKGIRAVADRLAEYQRAKTTLETYDAKGRRLCIKGLEQSRIERRA